MKFHYFAQLLVDSNCLLLILKMFGLQEVSTLVRTRNEIVNFKYETAPLMSEIVPADLATTVSSGIVPWQLPTIQHCHDRTMRFTQIHAQRLRRLPHLPRTIQQESQQQQQKGERPKL
jgi:predicted subunit of tRNA(5-methylaminomethyl-2-thiouridylate) methyltransferase